MDPISLSIAAMSIGSSIFGGVMKFEGAQQQEQIQQQEVGVEKDQNALRQMMMHVSAQRQQMELLRNSQRARSLALAGAAQHGAQFGSGLQGGFGQISGGTGIQQEKISQDTQASDQMFGFTNVLANLGISNASAGGTVNMGSGIMSIGQMLGQSNAALTGLTKQTGIQQLGVDPWPK